MNKLEKIKELMLEVEATPLTNWTSMTKYFKLMFLVYSLTKNDFYEYSRDFLSINMNILIFNNIKNNVTTLKERDKNIYFAVYLLNVIEEVSEKIVKVLKNI